MGYIIRNGIKYFGDNAVELTQAQYDALPSSKLTDGVDYYITDAQAGAPLATEIAMSTSDNMSVAAAIGELNSPILQTITAGLNLTNFEARVFKTGKIVNGYVVFKPTAAVADTNTIFASGFPIPAMDRLMVLFVVCVAGTNAGKTSRLAVNYKGELISWWHSSGFFNTTDTYFVATNYAAK